jgi:hypothetical protein
MVVLHALLAYSLFYKEGWGHGIISVCALSSNAISVGRRCHMPREHVEKTLIDHQEIFST